MPKGGLYLKVHVFHCNCKHFGDRMEPDPECMVLRQNLGRPKYEAPAAHLDNCDPCGDAMALLRRITGAKYRGSPKTVAWLHARIEESGAEVVMATIKSRWAKVKGTSWEWTMRPETLFNATKFDGYANDRQAQEMEKEDRWER